jgi:hypothetical protein
LRFELQELLMSDQALALIFYTNVCVPSVIFLHVYSEKFCRIFCFLTLPLFQPTIIFPVAFSKGVGIATGYGLDGPGAIPGMARFSLLHSVQTCPGAHPASYPMGTGCFLPGE